MAQNPHRHRRGERRGHGEPDRSAREQRQGAAIARLLARGLRQSTTPLAQQEPHLAASGQNSPCSPLLAACAVQNSPRSPKMAQFGMFCPHRESFVPLCSTKHQAGRILYRTRGRVTASHDSTPGPTSAEGTGGSGGGLEGPEGPEGPEGTGGPRAAGTHHGAGGRSQDHSQTNFACNSIGPNFNKPRKRCNSNDANSIFEQAAGELHAKLMIDSQNWATCSNPRPGRTTSRRAERSSQRGRLAGGPPPTGTPSSPAQNDRHPAPGTPLGQAARPTQQHMSTVEQSGDRNNGWGASRHPTRHQHQSTNRSQPTAIIQHSLRCQRLRWANLRGPAAGQPGGDERGHDGHDAHADQL